MTEPYKIEGLYNPQSNTNRPNLTIRPKEYPRLDDD